jgi:hypothetical protein
MLGPLLGAMAGIEMASAVWRQTDETIAVQFGDLIDVEVHTLVTEGMDAPVQLTNIFHPANTTLTVAPATKSRVNAFGISFDGTGTSGFHAPFAWAA